MAENPDAAPNPESVVRPKPPRARDYTGRTLASRYEVVGLLGRGGMGSVYLARHVVIGKPLALKVLDSDRVPHGRGYQRMFREAQTAATIGHPNIIEVIDVGVTPDSDPYLVMEYLEGEDLAGFLRREGPVSPETACVVLEAVLQALQAAHARGVVHRDLKPSNIFVVRHEQLPATIKLIDFGIAKVLGEEDRTITAPGALLGTPAYMAPEQVRGASDVDARADLYSAGIILFELLLGRVPFDAKGHFDVLSQIVSQELPVDAVPEPLRATIRRATHKDREDRFQSASDFLGSLSSLEAWALRGEGAAWLTGLVQSQPGLSQVARSSAPPRDVRPEAMASLMSKAEVPPDLVATVEEHASEEAALSRQTAGRRPAAVLFALVAAGVVLWALNAGQPRGVDSAPPPTAPEVSVESVSIRVEGAPSAARVTFGGRRVTDNPFVVPVSSQSTPLRVELDGYEPFEVSVTPTSDTVLRVDLQRADPPPLPSAEVASPVPRLPSSPAPAAPGTNSRMKRGARGTLYSEEFE